MYVYSICSSSMKHQWTVCGFICTLSHLIYPTQPNIWLNVWEWCNSRLHLQTLTNMSNLWGNLDLWSTFWVDWSDGVRARFLVMTDLIWTSEPLITIGQLRYYLLESEISPDFDRYFSTSPLHQTVRLWSHKHTALGFNILSVLKPGLKPEWPSGH